MSKRRSECPDPANPSRWIAVSALLRQEPDEDDEDEDDEDFSEEEEEEEE